LRLAASQEELALKVGIDRSYMGAIERGESNLTVLSAAKIAAALNLQASQLLEQAGL
jgi:transcriptional regulator with XRE-family HTH domain